MTKKRSPSRTRSSPYERTGLVASLVLHIILVSIILSSNAPHPPKVTTIEVTIEPPLARAKREQPQIVSPSQERSSAPPENTTRLSDVDSRADVEKIKRGDGGGIPGERSASAERASQQTKQAQSQRPAPPAPKQSQPQPVQQAKASTGHRELHLKDLTLDNSTLAMKFGNNPERASQSRSNQSPSQSLSEYQAFSRPPGSGAAFLGTAGISDHLPNLPDGDITMLNAKANIYASFVRRVAVQVFTQLRSQGWERLSAQQIRQLQGFSTIEAVLSPDGKFLRAQLIESSGSSAFDGVLNLSVQNGARDPNPPAGALAKDGLIHFIFKARSWSQVGVNRRSGAPTEQRWLLLATGLE
jgi:outer membrane biosynthesis protein TonB